MQTETFSLTIEHGENSEYTARIGNYTGVGTTRETALTALAQRIAGLANTERKALWGGQQTQTAG